MTSAQELQISLDACEDLDTLLSIAKDAIRSCRNTEILLEKWLAQWGRVDNQALLKSLCDMMGIK